MLPRLARLADQVAAAASRRPEHERLSSAVKVLAADYAAAATDDTAADDLDGMAAVFGLTELDVLLLVAAAAPELDATFATAFGLLSGAEAGGLATVGLALELAGAGTLDDEVRRRLGPASPLLAADLLRIAGDRPFPLRELRVPDRVVAAMLGNREVDADLAGLLADPVSLWLTETERLAQVVGAGVPLVWLRESPGAAGAALAVSALEHLDAPALVLDLGRVPSGQPLRPLVVTAVREAGLQLAGLVLTGADRLAEEDPGALALLAAARAPVLAVAGRRWDANWMSSLPVAFEAPAVTASERAALWRLVLGPALELDEDDGAPAWRELTGLRLSPRDIVSVARSAQTDAAVGLTPLSLGSVKEVTRRLGGRVRGAKIAGGTAGFADLVLPDDTVGSLHEMVSWARNREHVLGQGPVTGAGGKGEGIAALFSGSPGTGKTLAAHVIAAELGLDLQTVELSAVIDKYIGETEKNLERVFSEAEALNAVLFFDEADALFGSRSEVRDARDRYANQEVAYLLQRMETFNGITVLATNLRGNLDAAFSRRLHFIVHFPDPDAATRVKLWERHLAALSALDRDDPVDLGLLSDRAEVAGGDIRNIVLAAAYAAAAEGVPVGMRLLAAATEREFRKLGRRVPEGGFSPRRL